MKNTSEDFAAAVASAVEARARELEALLTKVRDDVYFYDGCYLMSPDIHDEIVRALGDAK